MAQEFNKTLAINHELRDHINHIRSERNVFNQLYRRVVHQLHVCKKQKADVLQSAAQALEHRYGVQQYWPLGRQVRPPPWTSRLMGASHLCR